MPAYDPQALAALLRQQNPMAGQGAISERERGYMNQMNQLPPQASFPQPMDINGLSGQGAVSEAERAMAMKAMQGMGGMGQGMGQMTEADRKFLMMQQGQ